MPQNQDPSAQAQLEALYESAVLGKQIENFLAGDVGKYLHARATRVYNKAVDEFKKVGPTDVAEIMRIQSDMWKAEAFMGWLSQGIQEGLTSLGILQGLEDDPEN